MKQIMAMACLFLMQHSYSQEFSNANPSSKALQIGTSYVHDIKQLNGCGAYVHYRLPLNDFLCAGFGLRMVKAAGYPNTQNILESTNATALDFSLMYVPIHTEKVFVRMGLLYSFSHYNVTRSYPVYTDHANPANQPDWLPQNEKGITRGMGLLGETEYFFGKKLSAGIRISYCQAYTDVFMVGPYMAVSL